jgi:hypothetical protein
MTTHAPTVRYIRGFEPIAGGGRRPVYETASAPPALHHAITRRGIQPIAVIDKPETWMVFFNNTGRQDSHDGSHKRWNAWVNIRKTDGSVVTYPPRARTRTHAHAR